MFLYVLKQISRQWFLEFDQVVTFFAFKESVVDHCVYLKLSSEFIILVLYVGDIFLGSDDVGFLLKQNKFYQRRLR